MVRNRYFMRIVSLVVVVGLTCMLIACSNDVESEESSEEESEISETTVSTELSFIIDEKFAEAMTEVQALYLKEHKEVGFVENQYVISDEVLQQIKDNALSGVAQNGSANTDDVTIGETEEKKESIADFFLKSSRESMDEIEELGLTEMSSRFDMLTTKLVIVSRSDSSIKSVEWSDIVSGSYQLALGDEATPGGNAARQALSVIGAYQDPTNEVGLNISGAEGEYQNITPMIGTSLDELISFIEEGKVDIAVIYADDAARVEGLKVVGEAPAGTYHAPLYAAAISSDSEYPKEIEAFLVWATSDEEALKVWQKHGLSFPS